MTKQTDNQRLVKVDVEGSGGCDLNLRCLSAK